MKLLFFFLFGKKKWSWFDWVDWPFNWIHEWIQINGQWVISFQSNQPQTTLLSSSFLQLKSKGCLLRWGKERLMARRLNWSWFIGINERECVRGRGLGPSHNPPIHQWKQPSNQYIQLISQLISFLDLLCFHFDEMSGRGKYNIFQQYCDEIIWTPME